MIYLQETTDWAASNHIYIVNDDKSKLHGYIIKGTTTPIMFSKPLTFNTRQRTFKTIKGIL